MRFSCRLQSLLNWKRSLEECSQTRLADKVRELQRQEEEIRRVTEQRLDNEKRLHEKTVRGVQVAEYLIHKRFGDACYSDLLEKGEKRNQALKAIEGEREVLVGLMKEKKMLNRLKEKRFRRYLYQTEKQDQKNLDEMALRSRRAFAREGT